MASVEPVSGRRGPVRPLLCLLAVFALGGSGPLFAGTFEKDFDALRSPQAVVDEHARKGFIEKAFPSDDPAAVSFVAQRLWQRPAAAASFEDAQALEMDSLVARGILAALPSAVQERLLEQLPDDPFKKARLLEAAQEFETERAIEALVRSLDDTRDSGLPLTLSDGWSLRVCDIAYNTLAHKLRLSGLRAPLGVGMSIASRDRWIVRLKEAMEKR